MRKTRVQRTIAFVLIGIQALALAQLSGSYLGPVLVALAALAGLPGSWQIELERPLKRRLAFALAVALLLKAQLWPAPHFPSARVWLPYAYAYGIAMYCLIFQTAQLFFIHADKPLPTWMPLPGIVALLYAGNTVVGGQQQELFRILAIFYIAHLTLYYAWAPRPHGRGANDAAPGAGRAMLNALAVVLVCAMSLSASLGVSDADSHIANWFHRLRVSQAPLHSSAGFASRSWLGSVNHMKRNDADALALRVLAQNEPGYLRGQAFTMLHGSEWRKSDPLTSRKMRTLTPHTGDAAQLPPPEPQENLFELRPTSAPPPPANWRTLDVRPAQLMRDAVFTSLDTALIGAWLRTLRADANGIVETPALPPDGRYRLFAPPTPEPEILPAETRLQMLSIPPNLDSRVEDLADALFRDRPTPEAKIAAVTNYLVNNYSYRLGIRIPQGEDPLSYFLLERPPAHCEYFASAATILLRLGGVPCRYVTGFVVAEKNDVGGYWIARNQDAHAWAEAYLPRQGWRIVEATPGNGVPNGARASQNGKLAQFWDATKFALARLKISFVSGAWKTSLKNLLNRALGLLRNLLFWPLLLIALAMLLFPLWWRRWRSRSRREEDADPLARPLTRLLDEMDRRLARRDLRRRPAETLHQFAARLATLAPVDQPLGNLADWYRAYATVRYRGHPQPHDLERLQQTFNTLGH